MKKTLKFLGVTLMVIVLSLHFIVLFIGFIFLFSDDKYSVFYFMYFFLFSILLANQEPFSFFPEFVYGKILGIFKFKKQN